MSSFLCKASLLGILLSLTPLRIAVGAPTPGETDLIRDRQERLLEDQRRRLEDLKELPGSPSQSPDRKAPADARCFPVQEIEIKSADNLSEPERDRLLRPYINQCLGVSQLNA
ncbi:ShlB/FhaC/HecB family hemolysin secretion/activation protein, partial [Pseudomonas sp. SWRI51]|uniref:POTRA domain-containing protein n=1 Tax=Pseudomonas sp. SWRI51 TaxID=2745491 RepID=UPI0019C8C836